MTPTVDDRLYLEPDDPVHDPERPILYREFVEGLVRIAAAVYEDDEEKPSLPDKFSALLDGPIKENSRTSVSAAGGKPTKKKKKEETIGRSDDVVMNALGKKETREWLQNQSDKLVDVFRRYGHVGFGGKNDVTLHAREFAALFKDCGVVVKRKPKKEEKKEEEEKAEGDGEGNTENEEAAAETAEPQQNISYPEGLHLMDVVLLFPRQKFGQKKTKTDDVDGDDMAAFSRPKKIEVFDPDDDATNFEMEMNYNEFVEMCCRIALAYHPVLYGRQCVADVLEAERQAEETKQKEEEAAAAAAAAEDEPVAEAGEGEDGEDDVPQVEGDQQLQEETEEEEVVDPSRLQESTEVLPALKRLCVDFLFVKAKKSRETNTW
jgi:hypothetical protein